MEKKTEKLKRLESLMEKAGMGTGPSVFNSEVFQKVAKSQGKTPVSMGNLKSSSSGKSNKISTQSSASGSQSYKPSSSFKNEVALKETKEELHEIKKAYYSLKARFDEIVQHSYDSINFHLLLELNEILEDDDKWNQLYSNSEAFKELIKKNTVNINKIIDEMTFFKESLDKMFSTILDTEKDENKEIAFYGTAILVVEDSITHRKIIQSMLESINFKNVIEAKNAKEALQLLNKHASDANLPKIAAITLDFEMSGGNGLELTKVIRHRSFLEKFPAYKDIPIIMISSKLDKLLLLEAAKVGINDFIKKPVDKKILEAKINKYIS